MIRGTVEACVVRNKIWIPFPSNAQIDSRTTQNEVQFLTLHFIV